MTVLVEGNSVGASQLANRRGFLLGVTIAEIMIITLFVLLLLFRHYEEEAGKSEILEELLGELDNDTLIVISELSESNISGAQQKLRDAWDDLVDCSRRDDPAACNHDADLEGLGREELESAVRVREDEINKQVEQLAQKERTIENLRTEIGNIIGKEGGLTICTHEPSNEKVKGPSIPLGALLLEGDGITLIARDKRIYDEDLVDRTGKIFDTQKALEELDNWPLGKKLSFQEFAIIGKKFRDIGDRPVPHRAVCRFTMHLFSFDHNKTNL